MTDKHPNLVSYQRMGQRVYAAQQVQRMVATFVSDIIVPDSGFVNWRNLIWSTQLPTGSDVYVYVRASNKVETINTAKWEGPYYDGAGDISSINSPYLQFMVVMFNDGTFEWDAYHQTKSGVSPLFQDLRVSFMSSIGTQRFYSVAFDIGFRPKHILLTYNGSIPENSLVRFAVSGFDTVDDDDYQFIEPNKIEELNGLSILTTKLKLLIELIGNNTTPINIDSVAFMFSGDQNVKINKEDWDLEFSSSGSSSSSSQPYIILDCGDIYVVPVSETRPLSFEYICDTPGSTAIVVLNATYSYVVGNVSGSFVWDIGGVDEHTFTFIGETISQSAGGMLYNITYDGTGSLLFTVEFEEFISSSSSPSSSSSSEGFSESSSSSSSSEGFSESSSSSSSSEGTSSSSSSSSSEGTSSSSSSSSSEGTSSSSSSSEGTSSSSSSEGVTSSSDSTSTSSSSIDNNICCSGFGSSAVNTTYPYQGINEGKRYWAINLSSIYIIWYESQWLIATAPDPATWYYYSDEDVPDPTQVISWTVGMAGSLPIGDIVFGECSSESSSSSSSTSISSSESEGNTSSSSSSSLALWTPADIPTNLWYDAADTNTINESPGTSSSTYSSSLDYAGRVGEWKDKSGNNDHLITFNPDDRPYSGGSTINNLNVIDFTTAQNMFNYMSSGFSGNPDLYVVCKMDSLTITGKIIDILSDGGGGSVGTYNGLGGTISTGLGPPPGSITKTQDITDDLNVHILNVRWDGTKFQMFMDGFQQGLNQSLTGNFAVGELYVGNYGFTGKIAEVVFVEAQSVVNRQITEGYLAWKWGLVSNLPNEHPYKHNPPYNRPAPWASSYSSSSSSSSEEYSESSSSSSTSISSSESEGNISSSSTTSISSSESEANTSSSSSSLELWTPADITTRVWHDASDTTTLTPASGAVSNWNDKSGNGYNMVQNTEAYRPISGATQLNNLNVLDFDGSNDYMQSLIGLPASSNALFIGVWDIVSPTSKPFLYKGSSSPTISIYNDKINLGFVGNNYSSGLFTGPHIFCGDMNLSSENAIGYIDGFNEVSFSYSAAITSGFLYYGKEAFGFSYPECSAAEVILVDDPAAGTREKIEGYLAWKWNLVANLPSNHRYKNYPPYNHEPVWLDSSSSSSSSSADSSSSSSSADSSSSSSDSLIDFGNHWIFRSTATTPSGDYKIYHDSWSLVDTLTLPQGDSYNLSAFENDYFIASKAGGWIRQYNYNGNLLASFPLTTTLSSIGNLWVDQDTGYAYLTGSISVTNYIKKHRLSDGAEVASTALGGVGGTVQDIYFDDDNVWVIAQGNNPNAARMQKYNTSLNYLGEVLVDAALSPRGCYRYNGSWYVTFRNNGTGLQDVYQYTVDGNGYPNSPLGLVGSNINGLRLGRMNYPIS